MDESEDIDLVLAVSAAFQATPIPDCMAPGGADRLVRKALAKLPASPDCTLLVRQRIETRLALVRTDPKAAVEAFREDARRMAQHATALERFVDARQAATAANITNENDNQEKRS